jgi:cytochrome P450
MDKLLADKERNPGEDLLSRLVVEQIRPGHLAREDAVGMARALLLAGHDTTATQISAGVLTLLQHPDQLAELKRDPSLYRPAVEEILRYFTITQHNAPRVAIQDVEIAGVTIKAGEGVIASVSAANRDPSVFENPDAFDIHRQADHHVAFAYGVHQCLGHALARLELQIVFQTLFERLPNLHVTAPLEQLRFKTDSLTYGVEALPVAW